jgi:predicted Zn-dependent protease
MDKLRQDIEREYVVERSGWAWEQARRVTERLQHDVPAGERLESLVVWWSEHTAFTTFGRTIYLSRRLFERLPDDDATAFVIAHEIAHHRLGHIPADVASRLLPARLLLALLGRLLCSPNREADADKLAIELCIAAGYDPERCVAALEILSLVSLDYGDVDGVLGGDQRRSHPPLNDRIAALREHAARVRSGERVDVERAIASERQRHRRRIYTAVGGAAALASALFVLRR